MAFSPFCWAAGNQKTCHDAVDGMEFSINVVSLSALNARHWILGAAKTGTLKESTPHSMQSEAPSMPSLAIQSSMQSNASSTPFEISPACARPRSLDVPKNLYFDDFRHCIFRKRMIFKRNDESKMMICPTALPGKLKIHQGAPQ